jgi:predicted PilT family ATPase
MLAIPTPQTASLSRRYADCSFTTDVRQVSADPEDIQLHMVVPERLVGALVGKEGQLLKQVGASTGCKLCMNSKDLSERRVILLGKYGQCVAAQQDLQQTLLVAGQQARIDVSSTSIIFYIRSTAVGAVIGRAGLQLKQIREQTGTKVQVDRDEVQGQRPCRITGTHEQVMRAVAMVHDRLVAEPDSEAQDDTSLNGPAPPPQHVAQSVGLGTSTTNMEPQRVEGGIHIRIPIVLRHASQTHRGFFQN